MESHLRNRWGLSSNYGTISYAQPNRNFLSNFALSVFSFVSRDDENGVPGRTVEDQTKVVEYIAIPHHR